MTSPLWRQHMLRDLYGSATNRYGALFQYIQDLGEENRKLKTAKTSTDIAVTQIHDGSPGTAQESTGQS